MEIEKYGKAKVVAALVAAADKMSEALSAAQMAKDEPLFHKLFKKQDELREMAAELVK